MPKVSVVLPTFNQSHLITRSIESILSQDYTDLELIIIDDGSNDDTQKVVMSFNDPRVRYLKNDINSGCSFSRNVGIENARGAYIGFLDRGDEWLDGKLSKEVRVLETTDADIVYSSQWRIDNGHPYVIKPEKIMPGDGIIYSQALGNRVRNINIQTALIRKSVFDRAGGFDEAMHRWSDFEFLIRAAKFAKFFFLDEPTIRWHDGEGNITSERDSLIDARKAMINKYHDDFISSNQRQALADHLYCVGHALCLKGQFNEGRKFLFQALKVYPLFFKAATALPATFFGKNVYAKLHWA